MTMPTPSPPYIPMMRRLLVGAAWALAWVVAWGGALVLFSARVQAAPLVLVAAQGPVSLPVRVAQARGQFAAEILDMRVQDCRSGPDAVGLERRGLSP